MKTRIILQKSVFIIQKELFVYSIYYNWERQRERERKFNKNIKLKRE